MVYDGEVDCIRDGHDEASFVRSSVAAIMFPEGLICVEPKWLSIVVFKVLFSAQASDAHDFYRAQNFCLHKPSNITKVHGSQIIVYFMHISFLGYWVCDKGETEISLQNLCSDYFCQDKTDESFCECGKGKWKCPIDGKCIKDTEVCDKHSDGCHCVQCSDEDEEFCNNVWQCPPGSFKVPGTFL